MARTQSWCWPCGRTFEILQVWHIVGDNSSFARLEPKKETGPMTASAQGLKLDPKKKQKKTSDVTLNVQICEPHETAACVTKHVFDIFINQSEASEARAVVQLMSFSSFWECPQCSRSLQVARKQNQHQPSSGTFETLQVWHNVRFNSSSARLEQHRPNDSTTLKDVAPKSGQLK